MTIIDGKKIAREIRADIRKEIAESGLRPGLAAVLVGDNPASKTYVRIKERACAETGIHFEKHEFPETAGNQDVLGLIKKLDADERIHGILVQLPLPARLDTDKIIGAIDPDKDVDGFHPKNTERIRAGKELHFISPLVAGISEMIRSTGIKLSGKKALVVANSKIFMETAAKILGREGLKADICEARRKGLEEKSRQADVLIVAAGRPEFVKADMIKENSLVIDAGYNRIGGEPVGDVDFESVSRKAAFVSPVPGGAGPMTVAMLLKNVLLAAERNS